MARADLFLGWVSGGRRHFAYVRAANVVGTPQQTVGTSLESQQLAIATLAAGILSFLLISG